MTRIDEDEIAATLLAAVSVSIKRYPNFLYVAATDTERWIAKATLAGVPPAEVDVVPFRQALAAAGRLVDPVARGVLVLHAHLSFQEQLRGRLRAFGYDGPARAGEVSVRAEEVLMYLKTIAVRINEAASPPPLRMLPSPPPPSMKLH